MLSETRTVTVIKLGGFTFLSGLSLTGAAVSLDGEEIVLSGVTVTKSGTGTAAPVTLRLRWDIGAQGLRLVTSNPWGRLWYRSQRTCRFQLARKAETTPGPTLFPNFSAPGVLSQA